MPRTAKAKTNRSQAIRDFLKSQPGAGAKVIKEALAKEGIKVSDSLINAVKYKKTKPAGGRKRGRPVSAKSNGNVVSIDSLLEIKKIVDKVGGVDAAEKAIAVLKRLES